MYDVTIFYIEMSGVLAQHDAIKFLVRTNYVVNEILLSSLKTIDRHFQGAFLEVFNIPKYEETLNNIKWKNWKNGGFY